MEHLKPHGYRSLQQINVTHAMIRILLCVGVRNKPRKIYRKDIQKTDNRLAPLSCDIRKIGLKCIARTVLVKITNSASTGNYPRQSCEISTKKKRIASLLSKQAHWNRFQITFVKHHNSTEKRKKSTICLLNKLVSIQYKRVTENREIISKEKTVKKQTVHCRPHKIITRLSLI